MSCPPSTPVADATATAAPSTGPLSRRTSLSAAPHFLARPAAIWRSRFGRPPSATPPRRQSPYPGLADLSARSFETWGQGHLPGWLGIQMVSAEPDSIIVRVPVREEMLAPHGYLHGGSVVSVADSACGYGAVINLPEEAVGFTTLELKTNFMDTVREGHLICQASPWHLGNRTQVWDAVISDERTERRLAIFRCTQLVLWPSQRGA
jgi:1,4-dihydroxy-2-naphthoyl-CoA hydrolase